MNEQKNAIGSGWELSGLESLSLGDYKRILLSRRWLIVITALLVAAGTAVAVYFLPNLYESTTVILVDPRNVLDNYVAATVSTTAADRLVTLREQILSATRLEEIINELDLYPELKKKMTVDDLVEQVRKHIEVEVVGGVRSDGDLTAFSVSFSANEPVQAARVTSRLASLFIEENIKSRQQQAKGTAEFIDRELEEARQDLAVKEQAIAGLKTKHASELPESQTFHVQALNSLQLQLRGEMDELNRAQQQKLYLQSLLNQGSPVVDLDRSASPALFGSQTQLSDAQKELDDLRRRYGPEYPEVVKKVVQIQDLERLIQKLNRESPNPKARPAIAPKVQNPVVESQIAGLDDQISQNLERQKDVKTEIKFHQFKLGEIPLVEQQMASVVRDYDVARDHYRMLLEKKFGADMASDLESRQKGEHFVVLDPAKVPLKPARPNRLRIDLMALAVGLVLGFGIALIQEITDQTVKTESDITAELAGPIYARIPWLYNRADRRRHTIRNAFLATSSALLAATYAFMIVLSLR